MNAKELAAAFAAQQKASGKAGNLYFNGRVCYSYGPHYPAAIIHGNRAFVNSDSYSSSTSRQVSRLRSALDARGFVITPRDTEAMRELARDHGQ